MQEEKEEYVDIQENVKEKTEAHKTSSSGPEQPDADKKSTESMETVVSVAKKKSPNKRFLMIIPAILLIIVGGFLLYYNSPEQKIKILR